ncbi:hypothetical protein E2C01_096080 [Portunus trituberculatus]|uniref:Uncharacterized protein n=1 Tax=Portunus trituberculatus TaxID=210409 RepID=A0A5B7K5P4_PORTR|nr:hypothetical protein [Portunus trituberculatus]
MVYYCLPLKGVVSQAPARSGCDNMVSNGMPISSMVNVCISGSFCPATQHLHLARQSILSECHELTWLLL